jgi:hypothetical protein
VKVCQVVRNRYQLGQRQNFKIYPIITEGKLGFGSPQDVRI